MILNCQILRCPSIGHYTECNLIILFKWCLKFFTSVNSPKLKPSFIFWHRLKSLYIVLIGCTYTQSRSCQLQSECSDIPISSPLPIDNMFFDYTQAYITIFFPRTDYIFTLTYYTWKPELPLVCLTSTTEGLLLHALDRLITTQI